MDGDFLTRRRSAKASIRQEYLSAPVVYFASRSPKSTSPVVSLSAMQAGLAESARPPRATRLGEDAMYFTRQTEIAISILTLCARQPGSYITSQTMAEHISASTESVERIMSMLLRNGLLRSPYRQCGVQLAVDPESVSLGALLHITQPSLLRPAREKKQAKPPATVFNLVVEAASSNFLRLAERYTVADFLDGRTLSGRHAPRGRSPVLQASPATRQQDCRGN